LLGSHYDFEESSDNLGFSASSWGLAAGFQQDFATDWSLGGALSYQDVSLSVDGIGASSEGEQVFAGLSLQRRIDAFEFAGSVNVGYGSFDMSRDLFLGETVEGRQEQWSAGAELRAAYLIGRGDWYLKPRVDLGVQHAANSDFTESGSSGLRLDVDSNSETYWYLQPVLDFGGEFETRDGLTVRPRLAAGITQYLGDSGPETTARFVDAPDGVDDFIARTAFAPTQFDLSAAVDVFARSGVTLRAKGLGHVSSKESGYGASLRLEIPFWGAERVLPRQLTWLAAAAEGSLRSPRFHASRRRRLRGESSACGGKSDDFSGASRLGSTRAGRHCATEADLHRSAASSLFEPKKSTPKTIKVAQLASPIVKLWQVAMGSENPQVPLAQAHGSVLFAEFGAKRVPNVATDRTVEHASHFGGGPDCAINARYWHWTGRVRALRWRLNGLAARQQGDGNASGKVRSGRPARAEH
jgi:Autotransporter beta-domain